MKAKPTKPTRITRTAAKSPAARSALPAAPSARAARPGRKAATVDPEIKAGTLRRLTRIEGQIRGLHKMVESERDCADILVQISSVQQALRGVSQQLMRNHLRHCASTAIRAGSSTPDSMYDELLDLIYRHAH
jgi:DNA-binding FrmR family transcriptional regulator